MPKEITLTEDDWMVGPANIGRRIKLARATKGWSQTELEKAAGVSRRHISDAENGNANIGSYTLYKILSALKLTIYVASPPVYTLDDFEREKEASFQARHGKQ